MALFYAKMKTPPEGIVIAYGIIQGHSGQVYVEYWKVDGTVTSATMEVQEGDTNWEFLPYNEDGLNALQIEFEIKNDTIER